MFQPVGWQANNLFDVLDQGACQETKMPGEVGHRVWVLDPIDGTKGFIRKEHYCIALALVRCIACACCFSCIYGN
jgi:3'-phosphoadenosine 5'-phosphosulfate (PAPS) 3'-phosphatase